MAVKCPGCGSYNATTAETCKKCGNQLIKKASSSTKEDVRKPQPMHGLFSRLFKRDQK